VAPPSLYKHHKKSRNISQYLGHSGPNTVASQSFNCYINQRVLPATTGDRRLESSFLLCNYSHFFPAVEQTQNHRGSSRLAPWGRGQP